MGDGALAEFRSVLDAVACAIEMQEAVAARQIDVPAGRRIVFRIGINLGDVVLEHNDATTRSVADLVWITGQLAAKGTSLASWSRDVAEGSDARASASVRDEPRPGGGSSQLPGKSAFSSAKRCAGIGCSKQSRPLRVRVAPLADRVSRLRRNRGVRFVRRMEVRQRIFGSALLVTRIQEGVEDAVRVVCPHHDMLRVDLDAHVVRKKVSARLINVRNIRPPKLH
jgi:hypothetical protein